MTLGHGDKRSRRKISIERVKVGPRIVNRDSRGIGRKMLPVRVSF